MQSLNSVGNSHKTLAVTGIGMLVAFLFLVPLTAFAAGSVTVSSPTAGSFVAPGSTITVSGTVSPAPSVSGTSIAVSIAAPNGQVVDANQFAVATGTGSFSGTFVTGGPTYSVNGLYTVNLDYNGATASVQVQYGNTTTSQASATGTTTTVQVTTTIVSVEQTTVTQQNNVQTTVTQVQQGATTTVMSTINAQTTVTQSYTGSDTGVYVGAVGIIVAIIAIVLAVLAMRKK